MKVSNMNNLIKAVEDKENEIEVHADFTNEVIKAGMTSTIIFTAVVIIATGVAAAAVTAIISLINGNELAMGISIILLCAAIFASTILLTLKAIQKIPLALSLKLRKYTVNKQNNRVVLKRK
ncbi:MAG: hypothetical protein IJV39_01895 [Ruminococcus sp.]|nr:hypothetical protein [Ruminococcus sp.]